MYYDTFPYFYTGDFDTFSDLSLTAAGKIKQRLRVISHARLIWSQREYELLSAARGIAMA